MAISLQADSTLPQGYILVDGQRAATVTTAGLSGLANNAVTTNAIAASAVTTEKIAPGAVITADLADGAVTAAKMSGGQSGSAPVYGCRAWVSWDSTKNAAGTSVLDNTNRFIIASGNVSSVLRLGNGIYRLTFTTSMPTSSYAVVGISSNSDGGSGVIAMQSITETPTVSTCRVLIMAPTGAIYYDQPVNNISIFA